MDSDDHAAALHISSAEALLEKAAEVAALLVECAVMPRGGGR